MAPVAVVTKKMEIQRIDKEITVLQNDEKIIQQKLRKGDYKGKEKKIATESLAKIRDNIFFLKKYKREILSSK